MGNSTEAPILLQRQCALRFEVRAKGDERFEARSVPPRRDPDSFEGAVDLARALLAEGATRAWVTTAAPAELTEVVGELTERLTERDEMLERHRGEVAEIDGEISDLQRRRDHLAAGTTDEELRLARELIEVTWRDDEFDEQVVQEAVEDIAAGCLTLRTEYFCRRVYEGNLHRETYEYNFGPRHGHAVFRVGLTEGARAFFGRWGKLPLGVDGDVQQAAIRYLLNLREAGRP